MSDKDNEEYKQTYCFLISLDQVISLNVGVFKHAPRIPKKREIRVSRMICVVARKLKMYCMP